MRELPEPLLFDWDEGIAIKILLSTMSQFVKLRKFL